MSGRELGHQKNPQLLPSVHCQQAVQVLGLGSLGLMGDSLWEVYHSRKQSIEQHLSSLVFYESYIFDYTACSRFWEVQAL